MYSSNQILDITCEPRDLARVLDFAVGYYGDEIFKRRDGRIKMAYAEPLPGMYALGTGSMEPYQTGPNKGWTSQIGKGWTDFPFDYDPEIIARIASQWLDKNPPDRNERPDTDGSVKPAFRVRCLSSMHDELPYRHELPNWDMLDCILILTPCWMRYDK